MEDASASAGSASALALALRRVSVCANLLSERRVHGLITAGRADLSRDCAATAHPLAVAVSDSDSNSQSENHDSQLNPQSATQTGRTIVCRFAVAFSAFHI